MKKNFKLMAIFLATLAGTSLYFDCGFVFARYNVVQVDSYKRKKYECANYDLYFIRKGEQEWVHYINRKSKIQFLFTDKSDINTIFLKCPTYNDKGLSHIIEHLFGSVISNKLLKRYGSVSHKHFNGETIDHGFYFRMIDSLVDKTNLGYIIDELQNPTFLRDNKETFNREAYSKKDNMIRGRVYHEVLNNELSNNSDVNSLKNLRNFDHGGKPEDVKTVTLEEVENFYHSYVRPDNILCCFGFKDDEKKIKEILGLFDERYSKQKANKTASNFDYKLRVDEKNKYSYREWDKNSRIFRQHDERGNNSGLYRYVANVCFDIENLNLAQKDTLNLYSLALMFYDDLTKFVKRLGYDFVKVDTDDLLKGKIVFSLYGSNSEKFKKEALESNIFSLLDEVDKFLNKYVKPFAEENDGFCVLNKLADDKLLDGNFFNQKNKYKKHFDIYDLFYYSFNKYGTPFSNKVFDIRDGEIIDNKGIATENFKDNIWNIFKSFNFNKDKILYIDVFKKTDIDKKNNGSLLNPTPLVIKNYKNKYYFRFVEDFILGQVLNHRIRSLGLSYRTLLKAPYIGGSPLCIANPESRKSIEVFLNGEGIKSIKDFDFNEIFFREEIVEYLKNLESGIAKVKRLLELLKLNKNEVEKFKLQNLDVLNKEELFTKLKKEVDDFDIFFDDKETYEEHKKNVLEYENWFKYNVKNASISRVEEIKKEKRNEFYDYYLKYIEYNENVFNRILEDLNDRKNNIDNIKYNDAVDVIKSIVVFKTATNKNAKSIRKVKNKNVKNKLSNTIKS